MQLLECTNSHGFYYWILFYWNPWTLVKRKNVTEISYDKSKQTCHNFVRLHFVSFKWHYRVMLKVKGSQLKWAVMLISTRLFRFTLGFISLLTSVNRLKAKICYSVDKIWTRYKPHLVFQTFETCQFCKKDIMSTASKAVDRSNNSRITRLSSSTTARMSWFCEIKWLHIICNLVCI